MHINKYNARKVASSHSWIQIISKRLSHSFGCQTYWFSKLQSKTALTTVVSEYIAWSIVTKKSLPFFSYYAVIQSTEPTVNPIHDNSYITKSSSYTAILIFSQHYEARIVLEHSDQAKFATKSQPLNDIKSMTIFQF